MILITKTAPLKDAIELDFAKEVGRIQINAEDNLTLHMIRAATIAAENELERSLINRTYELYMDEFPACGIIELRKPPVISVASIQYRDEADTTWTTFAATDYRINQHGLRPCIELRINKQWPTAPSFAQGIRVTYDAGYGTEPESIPANMRIWIAMLVGSMHEHREADASGAVARLPFVGGLIDSHRIFNVR